MLPWAKHGTLKKYIKHLFDNQPVDHDELALARAAFGPDKVQKVINEVIREKDPYAYEERKEPPGACF